MKLSNLFKTIGRSVKSNSSSILIVTGIVGYGIACYFSAKGYESYKAEEKTKKEELKVDILPTKEKAKLVVKHGWKAGLAYASSTFCVGYSHHSMLKQNALLAVALKGTETALLDFKNETKAIAGEEVYKKIESATSVPDKPTEVTDGRTFYLSKPLWRDDTYGGYFYATQADIDKVFFKWSNQLSKGIDVSPADVYYDLHNGEILQRGDQEEYLASDYQFTDFEYHIADYYVTAPNGERATVIFYDLPHQST